MTETKEFSEVKRKESIDEIEVWMSEQETLHPIREVLEKAYNEGFKAGQEQKEEEMIDEYADVEEPICELCDNEAEKVYCEKCFKEARQDALEEVIQIIEEIISDIEADKEIDSNQ